jgi:hypothetical protein
MGLRKNAKSQNIFFRGNGGKVVVMSIIEKEPNLPLLTPRSLSAMRGAFRVLVVDPVKAPSKYSHDGWYVNFIEDSIRNIPGWQSEYFSEIPEVTNNAHEILLLVGRSDGKSWPASTGRNSDLRGRTQGLPHGQ